jgi:hypothetical protein
MVSSTLIALSLLTPPPPWTPHSSYPPLGYGATPTTQNVVSEAIFTQAVWVRDWDTYIKPIDQQQEFKEEDTGVTIHLTSGTRIGNPNESYDDSTNIRTLTFVIKANKMNPNVTDTFIDRYRAFDRNQSPVRDNPSPEMLVFVTVAGPRSGGGGS